MEHLSRIKAFLLASWSTLILVSIHFIIISLLSAKIEVFSGGGCSGRR